MYICVYIYIYICIHMQIHICTVCDIDTHTHAYVCIYKIYAIHTHTYIIQSTHWVITQLTLPTVDAVHVAHFNPLAAISSRS